MFFLVIYNRIFFTFSLIAILTSISSCQPALRDLTGELQSSITDNVLIAKENALILNKLLQKEKNKGTTIQLPKGITWIGEPIIVPSGITMSGHPLGSQLAISAAMQNVKEGFIVNENYVLYTAAKDDNIVLQNFTLQANGIKPATGQPRGIYFNKVHQVAIKNIQVFNTVAEGIRIDASNVEQTSENVSVLNCLINKRGSDHPCIMVRSFTDDGTNSTNIATMVSEITLQGNTCIGGGQGILLFNTAKINVLENTCIANLYRGIIAGPTCENIIIRKNKVDSAGSTGIHMAYFSRNILRDSNVVTNSIADLSGKGGEGQGIKAYVGFTGLSIINNTCINNATDGIALEGGAYGSKFIITGNKCEKNKRNGIRIWAGKLYADKRGDIESGLIENNKLSDNLEEGLFIGSDDNGRSKVRDLKARKNTIRVLPGRKKMSIEHTAADVVIEQ